MDTKKIVGENIRLYIDSVGRNNQWVINKTGIPRATFYNLLNGEGDLSKGIEKLNELFGIKDPFYFFTEDLQLPQTLKEKQRKAEFRNLVAAEGEEKEFQKTLDILSDFIKMIELLRPYENLS
ncbi:hypothetical protein HPT25_26325 [Bacillus sp. BRMEA1]|uniref:hypothetical protein n=1 Tax=Neobacillus endophyticus TaxID=2738405 RepID=UPI00156398EE|nr:hypothetical protein [Neobacillus endophyticus]NRD80848.1 hypothetical protein [Neobacillus endophyticus]